MAVWAHVQYTAGPTKFPLFAKTASFYRYNDTFAFGIPRPPIPIRRENGGYCIDIPERRIKVFGKSMFFIGVPDSSFPFVDITMCFAP
jgi:hypothetical protein